MDFKISGKCHIVNHSILFHVVLKHSMLLLKFFPHHTNSRSIDSREFRVVEAKIARNILSIASFFCCCLRFFNEAICCGHFFPYSASTCHAVFFSRALLVHVASDKIKVICLLITSLLFSL